MYMPETATYDLPLKTAEGRTDISITKLSLWGGVLLEQQYNSQ
jgi:hypothetical protein